MYDHEFLHALASHDEFLHALANSDLDELIRLLVLYAHDEHDADGEMVFRAFREALDGEHKDLYRPGLTHFAFLALVINKIA